MTIVTWNPAWETGIQLIDEQHRQLLAQFEALMVAIHEQRPDGQVPGLLAFLSDYVEIHFSTEEGHMKATQYPDFIGHKAVHDGMRAHVVRLVDGCQQDPSLLTQEILDFLTDWLIDHINDHDRRMARHLQIFAARESRAKP
jgi:hemerythrin-like metal-binding protein